MIFGQFLRSRQMRELDHSLRAAGLHPMLLPEAVKITTMKLLKDAGGVTPPARDEAARLLAYCRLGATEFAAANGAGAARAVEQRIEAALAAGDSLDARLVLLTMHAGMIEPGVVDRYSLESG